MIPQRAVLVRSLQDLPTFKPRTHSYLDVEFVNRIDKPMSIQFTAKGINHIVIGKEQTKVQLSELDSILSLPIEVKVIEKATIEEITINVSYHQCFDC